MPIYSGRMPTILPERVPLCGHEPHRARQWAESPFGDRPRFPPAKLEEVRAGIGAAIDTTGGSFTMNYTAVAITAELRREEQP
jgi:hypothetical protein